MWNTIGFTRYEPDIFTVVDAEGIRDSMILTLRIKGRAVTACFGRKKLIRLWYGTPVLKRVLKVKYGADLLAVTHYI